MRMVAMVAAAALAVLATPARAVVYTLAGDWSDAANPNGVWAYGPGLTHYAQPGDGNALNPAAANGFWGTGPTFATAPFMIRTTANGSALTGGYGDGDFLAGDVIVHAANSGAPTFITWTAPGAGTIAVDSRVWYAHSPVARSADLAAFLNATTLGSATVTNGITRPSALTLVNAGGLSVAAGDVVRFSFAKSPGQQFGSLSGISASIDFTPTAANAVPEPASWALLIAGFGGIGAAMRRRRTSVAFA